MLGGNAGWNLGLAAGPIFADQRYHQHFYGVDPAYATAARPIQRAAVTPAANSFPPSANASPTIG
ncbi:MAG: MipA/OmpV family protein [Sulfuricella sp.]